MKRTILVVVRITAVIMLCATTAWSGMLLGTTGNGSLEDSTFASTLVEIDPDTGATLRTIGPVGYIVNGLEYDATTGKLYGSTSMRDPNFNGLIEIDIDTGAGTPIGVHGWDLSGGEKCNDGYTAVTNITVDSTGQMYGWWDPCEDDLVVINKFTGVATRVGESYVGTARIGLDFDNFDTLYMVNYFSDDSDNIYTVNLETGLASSTGHINTTAHHGDFDPWFNLYYGISSASGSRNLLVADLLTGSVISVFDALDDNIHVITFVGETNQNQPPVAACQDAVVVADDEYSAWVAPEKLAYGSYDPDDDPITITIDPAGPYLLGDTPVIVTVTDDSDESDTCYATVTVVLPQATVDTKKVKVCWHHDDIHVEGKLYLPEGIWKDTLSPAGSAEITLAGVRVASQILDFETKGKKDEKWEYKDKNNLDGDIKEFKIDWKEAKFDYKGDLHIHTHSIVEYETTLCIHTEDASEAFAVAVNGTTIEYDVNGDITTNIVYEPRKDDNSHVHFTLPFQLTPDMTVEVAGSVELRLNVADYYEEGYAKFKLVSAFDPVLFPGGTNTLPDELEYFISLGIDTNTISGSDLIGVEKAWTKQDDKHWEEKPEKPKK
jgi:hypothetical protein